ncbi:MAG: aminodeoxychorismate synthase component I [Hyphomicrobiales bacterium]
MKSDVWEKMNMCGRERKPFFFMIDFALQKPMVFLSEDLCSSKLKFVFPNGSNVKDKPIVGEKKTDMKVYPPSYDRYQKAFRIVHDHLMYGNSYLLNLTLPSKIEINLNLEEIFYKSKAPYKLWYNDQLVVFSPEAFIKIKNGKVFSYPMKGTIDATIPNAEQIIIEDEKELAEHYTIVDLIRNDLSRISKNVKVNRFRYIDKINTVKGSLLQVSSEIVGDLPDDYDAHLGDLLYSLLPAGSISGAPKKKTVEIIQESEQYDRGYYTGVCGYFDGEQLESAVMIRYIEHINNEYYFKSGGGITVRSDCKKEYEELIAKVYVPFS